MIFVKRMMILALVLLVLGTGCQSGEDASVPTPAVTAVPTPVVTPVATAAPSPTPVPIVPGDEELVPVGVWLPSAVTVLPYATEENFTGQRIYDFTQPWLRYGTLKKLMAAQELLLEQGYGLLIWDAYRPHWAQEKLWDVVRDPRYVSNPATGSSSHCRGNTVDVTLVRADGTAVEMPSGFDEFSPLGDRDYRDVSEEAAANARLLEQVMTQCGFRGYVGEWWHYTDTTDYDGESLKLLTLPVGTQRLYTADCREYITLRVAPSYDARSILHISAGETVELLGLTGEFARVRYGQQQGYVAAAYLTRQ